MSKDNYFHWLIHHTPTMWWHDSVDPAELQMGLERGAVGVTTNPFLSHLALHQNCNRWAMEIQDVLSRKENAETKAESLMRIVITDAAHTWLPEYKRSEGKRGYVCAQVNPNRAGDREVMRAMARRFHSWAPNIAVKLPATAAGLDVLEDCIVEGITVTATVSFTVPQVIAVAERHRQGILRARQVGKEPGKCFAVIMIGRLDDYLREGIQDFRLEIAESDIRQAGLAVTKRAYAMYQERGYEAVLLVAALRGAYHMTELAGAELIMSIAPTYQDILLGNDVHRRECIHNPVPADVVKRLSKIPEFIRAYEPEAMSPQDFINYGVTQKTLAQFYEGGWKLLENFQSNP